MTDIFEEEAARAAAWEAETAAEYDRIHESQDLTVGEQHRGQARIAYRFANRYRHRLMYVNGLGWRVWDGKRWAADQKGATTTAVLDVLRAALADSITDHDLRIDVRKSESANGIDGVLRIASALPGIRVGVDELDADPYLINCANGTLDLRTRTVRPHDPADRITRVARGAYSPTERSRDWLDFLAQILPDDEERAYLQRIAGQAIYGAVREHLFPILTGTGANGKGTAYGALVHALGDYGIVIDPNMLLGGGKKGGPDPELLQLMGARLVVGSETEEGQRLDAAKMKRLTGGDQMTTRGLYSDPVSWKPSHQILYVTNHMPEVNANDPAVWRRIRVIPFDVVIPPHERDGKLPDRLELAADAILTWAVEGWFAYEDNGGMGTPESVTRATSGYRDDSDDVKQFIEDECYTGDELFAPASDLFAAWSKWAGQNGAKANDQKWFAKELKRLGYTSGRSSKGVRWRGVAVPAWHVHNPPKAA